MTRIGRVQRRPSLVAGFAATAMAVMLATCGSSSSSKPKTNTTGAGADQFFAPAPPANQVLSLVESAGLEAETSETLIHHVHAHLDMFVNGQRKRVPAGIGIVTTDPAVHHNVVDDADQYGGITKPCATPCISPLHTHDVTGTLHTESASDADNTLGQFFKEWNVKLDDHCVGGFCTPTTPVKVFVQGAELELSKAPAIALADQTEIAVVIGTPPAQIPKSPDFEGGA